MTEEVSQAVGTSLLTHLLTVGGFLLAVFALARLASEKRQPSNTVAWLLMIILIPYVGVPLFLLFGGRKIQRLARNKRPVVPRLQGIPAISPALAAQPTPHTITSTGAGAPAGGNTVRLITTGEQAFTELETLINEAKHSIHIATFILGRDDTGRRIINLLAKRAREGVKVRLQLDALGCLFSSRGFADVLRNAGGEVVRFMPVVPLSTRSSANLRNHRKIAVFDQHTAIVGGHNLAHEYMGAQPLKKRWADFGAVISGPAAALLNEVFLADWSFASRQPIETLRGEADSTAVRTEGDSAVHIVASGPDVHGDPLYEGIISMIQEAETSILIITPYFIPDEVLLRSLIVKARSGKNVTLVIPAKSNHPVTDFARRHYVRQMTKAGARVLHHTGRMMHSKAVIVDDRIGLLGSANFDLRSLFVNFEIGVFLYSEADVRAMRAWADELLATCSEPKPEPRPRTRLLGNLAEDLSRLFAPLL
ncbi:phospholipase D-like domain-containing protein [Rariglobus hedericola]|uniref:Cardiolipin synthase n=1 Tax=Rariglobus hedericola TaxID=2597822 RepID=A0A556QQW4_9BACT|nr:phospholipase D-like domain-containing protein [Rariglobus hedericola]TSJ79035.1 cardiolipin synthase [Rariglobus hedericola]